MNGCNNEKKYWKDKVLSRDENFLKTFCHWSVKWINLYREVKYCGTSCQMTFYDKIIIVKFFKLKSLDKEKKIF